MKYILALFSLAGAVTAHGAMRDITIDGTDYRTFDARIDSSFKGLRSIEWSYNNPPFFGQGPVTDVNSPDIACQKEAKAPVLRAKARAGSQVIFQWTPYFALHKGPVMTYLGKQKTADMAPQEVDFFKINEVTLDPKTDIWGSDELLKNNGSWPVQLPSDITPGNYILRNELIALHAALTEPTASNPVSGAQFYPVCFNVEIIGDGTVNPPGEKFPGAYKATDPGILDNIYQGVNKYISPGPPLYKGSYDAPKGVKPTVTDTGAVPQSITKDYEKAQGIADALSKYFSDSGNTVVPGGGGCHWEEGQTEADGKCTPINQGVNPLEAFNPAQVLQLIQDLQKIVKK